MKSENIKFYIPMVFFVFLMGYGIYDWHEGGNAAFWFGLGFFVCGVIFKLFWK